MPDGSDWLWRPVLAGMCSAESLKGTVLTLCDIADMNDALSVREDNEALLREYLEQSRR